MAGDRVIRLQPRTWRVVEEVESHARVNGLVTWREAEDGGLSWRTVEKLCAMGRWRSLDRGVYAVAAAAMQAEAAALLSRGPPAFLQRLSAAWVHGGLDVAETPPVDVAVPPGCSDSTSRRRRVPEEHVVTVGDLRTTDLLQTLLDLAVVLDDERWEWALEATLRTRTVTLADIEAALAASGRKDRAAVHRVRRVLAARPTGAPPTDSLLETRFVQLCRRAGLPDPVRQHRIVTAGRIVAYLDLAWPEVGLFVELDGQSHAGQPTYDARRETAVVAATGWLCGRFTWTEVVRNPTPTSRRLRALYEQAQRRPLPTV